MVVHFSTLKPAFNVDRSENDFVSELFQSPRPSSYPAIDVAEDENSFEIIAELPGMKKEDVRISIEDGRLLLSGERKPFGSAEGMKVLLHETNTRPFQRSFSIPEGIDLGGIVAEMKNGILRIRLPKTEHARPREIAIR